MDDVMIEIHLENLDRRLTRIEQILPTLATKEDLGEAIASAVAPLVRKEELRQAIAPLATKEELERSTGQLEILIEARGDDIRLLAEAVASLIAKIDAWGPRPS